jgi:hypothetical protein
MRRIKEYIRFVSWQAGVSYIALWGVTFWTIHYGQAVFGHSGSCHVDSAKIMFYWACDPSHAVAILAAMANTALTITLWAPVYIAAATVRADAWMIAAPIIAAHLIGLPTAILVMTRFMLLLFAALRQIGRSLAGGSRLSAPNERPAGVSQKWRPVFRKLVLRPTARL